MKIGELPTSSNLSYAGLEGNSPSDMDFPFIVLSEDWARKQDRTTSGPNSEICRCVGEELNTGSSGLDTS